MAPEAATENHQTQIVTNGDPAGQRSTKSAWPPINIQRLTSSSEVLQYQPSLVPLFQSCTNLDPPKSSMGFFAPVSEDDAAATWANDGAALDTTPLLFYMFIATDPGTEKTGPDQGRVIATVQLAVQSKQTHQHRAELRRLIVLPEFQGRGYGRVMTEYAESFARDELGLEMLTLSTGTITPAREFYLRAGWTEWGICPGYAKGADMSKQDISFFYKDL